jgi:uncharacterized protein YcbK (DUF882 family)
MTSEHFSHDELMCKCGCGANECTSELLAAAEQLRSDIGMPVIVVSAYRCPEHNRKVGGAANSQHTLGKAMDIRVPGLTPLQLERAAEKVPAITGIGRDDHAGYVHIDVRPGPRARWCYAANGKWCAYYPAKTAA